MKRILIIRFSSLGDIILTEPIVRALRASYPDAQLHYLTKPQYSAVVEMFAAVDSIERWEGDQNFRKIVGSLRRQRHDLIVDLHNNLRSARVRTALGGRSVKCGKDWFQRFSAVHFRKLAYEPRPAIERYSDALAQLGIPAGEKVPVLVAPEPAKEWWRNHRSELGLESNYAVFAAGARYPTKQAPASLFAQIAAKLIERGIGNFVVLGSPAEAAMLRMFVDEFRGPVNRTIVHVVTPELITRSAALLEAADAVVSNDTGPAHLSAALGRPTVALFGPTHPRLGFSPVGRHASAYSINESCSPCSLHGERSCWRDKRYCFLKMDVEQIVSQLGL